MDPDAALKDLLENLAEGDRETAISAAEALMDWMRRGGAMPTVKTCSTPLGEPGTAYYVPWKGVR